MNSGQLVRKILENFESYRFFTGPSQNREASLAFMQKSGPPSEEALTFQFFADGLKLEAIDEEVNELPDPLSKLESMESNDSYSLAKKTSEMVHDEISVK